MRVKGFSKTSMEKLEKVINHWLEENPQIQVMDIKYQYSRGVTDVYSALILYQDVSS